jgi:CHAT domain/Effector-associated domain 11
MSENNNLQSQIQTLVGQAKIEEALDVFAHWASTNNNDLYNSVILLKGRYSSSKRNENLGLVSFSDASRDRAMIANSILELSNQIKVADPPKADSTPSSSTPTNVRAPDAMSNKILFLASNPLNTDKLELEREFARLFTSLKEGNIAFDVQPEWTLTPQDLQTALLRHRPRILHFSGHGAGKGAAGTRALGDDKSNKETPAGIYFQDSKGMSQLVSEIALANLFKICLRKFPIEVVLLNACHSKTQAEAISLAGVPYVIGMSEAVNDTTAIAFSSGFYRGISSENDVEFAFDLARSAVMLEGLPGEHIPMLYKGGKVINS